MPTENQAVRKCRSVAAPELSTPMFIPAAANRKQSIFFGFFHVVLLPGNQAWSSAHNKNFRVGNQLADAYIEIIIFFVRNVVFISKFCGAGATSLYLSFN